ncbi:MAG: YdeI/OmpD-associated family protein [Candidatus Uhrbacteria bacterium]|nr:YdeI/OmpD-associated family protein [Candidatus Uhrbacteria bacterium]
MIKKTPKPPVHTLPKDMREALVASPPAYAAWKTLTPLARNEWICWVISVKKAETRVDHLRRLRENLIAGKRRPCCFAGCIHR